MACAAAATRGDAKIGLGKSEQEASARAGIELDASLHFTHQTLADAIMPKNAPDVGRFSHEMIQRPGTEGMQDLGNEKETTEQVGSKEAKEDATGMMAERDWYYLKIMRIKEATELELERCEADPHGNGLPGVFARFISDLCVSED